MAVGSVETFDVVVVGSGFGGSVIACRAAEQDKRVLVLERGRAYRPGDFPRTPLEMSTSTWDPSEDLYGVFQLWSFRRLDAVVASGVGGGSLIYANVTLPMPVDWFDAHAGRWPLGYGDIAEHYPAVEKMLAVERLPEHLNRRVPKTVAFTTAAEAAGMQVTRAPVALTFSHRGQSPGDPFGSADNLHRAQRSTCRLCGECDIGCNEGAKNSLDFTYLTRAASADRIVPAEVRQLSDVRRITAVDGGYLVDYFAHQLPDPPWERTRRTDRPYRRVLARKLVVSAGALGTTRLLLANRAGLPNLSPALGTRFSGNGDALGFLAGPRNRIVESSAGPVITAVARRPDSDFFVEDGGHPGFAAWLAAGLEPAVYRAGAVALARRWWRSVSGGADSNVSADVARVLEAARTARSTLPLLAMGMDPASARMRLDEQGRLDVDWSPAASDAYFERIWSAMAAMAKGSGGRFRMGWSARLSRAISAHPLGGAPMAAHPADGVVDGYGRVFGHPGLYVADGSVMPGPVGANPSLTIAALAERFAARMGDET